ncbi:MAG TPA: hypothetical protein VIV11_03665 [Kofleriaceae bacterium]
MRRQIWVALAIAFVPTVAAADKYDDAFAKTQKLFESYKASVDQYAGLKAKYDQYYAPLRPQWELAQKAHAAAKTECDKNKRTKACRDKTMTYAAEQKKYNAMVWDRDNADPKQEFDEKALAVVNQELVRRRDDYDAVYKVVKKMLEDAAFKTDKAKARRDALDTKLATMEKKRAEQTAKNTSAEADAKNPPRSTATTNSGGSGGSPTNPNGAAAIESAKKMGEALGKQ